MVTRQATTRIGWRWLWPLAAMPVAVLAAYQAKLGWQHSDLPFETSPESTGLMRTVAQAALRKAPLDVGALRQLGVTEQLEGSSSGAKLFRLVERISRRDLATQLVMIEHSAQNGDVEDALRHYDHALSVHPQADTLLFPLLAQALIHEPIRSGLNRYYARAWFVRFINRASALNADPLALNAVLTGARTQLDDEIYNKTVGNLITRLLAAGDITTARKISGRQATDIGFSLATSDIRHGVLGWRLVNNETVKATIGKPGQLIINVMGNRSSEVARRVTLLEPGRYTLVQEQGVPLDVPRARLTWKILCYGGSQKTIVEAILPDKSKHSTDHVDFTIPLDCPAQEWRLWATSSLSQFSSERHLSELDLIRMEAN